MLVNEGGPAGRLREFLFRRYGVSPRFMRRLRERAPTLVHAHFGPSGPAAMFIARTLGIPFVVTFHGKDATMTQDEAGSSHRGRELLKHRDTLMERASAFIAVSDYIRAELLDQGFPADKVLTHRNGIDIEYFSPRPVAREPMVVFVGRFVEKKGCEYLLEAMAEVRDSGVAARTVLIGDGPLRDALEARAKRLRIDAVFPGCAPR